MQNRESLSVPIQDHAEAQVLFGQADVFLKIVEDSFNAKVILKSDGLKIVGDDSKDVHRVGKTFESLLNLVRSGQQIDASDVKHAVRASKSEILVQSEQTAGAAIPVYSKRGIVRPKTPGQRRYVEAIKNHDLVIGIGPAGTGKTYLAMAMAVSALKGGQISRILLTRPAVEAGEKLGFLPGDIAAKIDPYLRPLYDALYDMIPPESLERYLERNIIEVAPLAFMRGRTLNNSFVVLDEAQNATVEQMKMFLTRLGYDSKAVVTGDITQTDLPFGKMSGLADAQAVLSTIEGIACIHFSSEDVVRHELVQRIVEAYESREVGPSQNPNHSEENERQT